MISYCLEFESVDVFAKEDKLAISTNFVVKPGTELVIKAPNENFFVEVVNVTLPSDGDWRHDYYVTVRCDKMEELRKAFTYEIFEART